ncbi:tesmin TSO1-like CXC domain protein (macronuclear) [Tetrahymena thermophila SB210]|uniref:Tesmin TSO1-like CXC domain protein n=1 Tax=Tetrahymena thermophila (strain SB210) TaxID=312017 RepID=Q23RD0_TETTS|nr:tesmin TSO1-like CXC domain protein [Tetrahymena thermophila SB210]EAR99118.2 tesmin TSO1-like CXC domain protein [Tetrahymena thermophila SB210]|eukprot:XP_001019363.2 tesmin TSO1-like CXC domain protein [Tetrahymena thermophila SB210]
MSIQPNQFTSGLERQIDLQNLSFQSNAQGNNNSINGNGNVNQSFNFFQNRMSAQSNGKMSIDSVGYNPNLLAALSGIGGADALNNISPDKSQNSIRDPYRNNSLFPSQIERKTIDGMSNIENRLSEYQDQLFDFQQQNQRCSLEDTLQMTANRNSQFQNSSYLSNNIYQSNRNNNNNIFGRYQSQVPCLNSMYNNMYTDDKSILQSTAPNQLMPQSYRINTNQFGFSNPQYISTQTVASSQMQSIIGETALADNVSMGTQNNSASAMSLEVQNFEKALLDQLEQPNRVPGDIAEQFAITSSTNQVTYPSSVGGQNPNFYNLNAAGQNVAQSQIRYASGLSAGNSGVPLISVAQSQANLINILNQTAKANIATDQTNIFSSSDAQTLKLLQQQQQQQQLQRQILLSSGSGMIDIGMTFGNLNQQKLFQQQFNGQQPGSVSTAASVGMGFSSLPADINMFETMAAVNVKTENVGENEGNDSDKTEKGGQKEEKEQKRQIGNTSYPSITRGAAFSTKQEVYSDDIFNSLLNLEESQDRQMSITNDNINKFQEKMSLASNIGINRSLNINRDTKKENESLNFNEIKQEKDSIGGLSDLGSAINFQNNNNILNISGFNSGGNLSIQRGSNLANFKNNNRTTLISRLSNGTRNSDLNRISFPTFDYDQKQFLESNGIAIRDQHGNYIIGQSNRSSAMNSESVMQDEENEKKKKAEEIIACNCGKTKCLKLYCVCFQQGLMCSDQCRCTDCYNKIAYLEERERAIKAIKQRYPDAFEKKVNFLPELARKIEDAERLDADLELQNQLLAHKKGCNCKKSACKKKYCECFLAGVKCTYLCRCEQCQNGKNDGPENQGQHINIEGQNFVDQENYNKGNVVSIKTQNNTFGNIKLEVFRPIHQQQFITKIERNSNQLHENGENQEDNRIINMENDNFNGEKLNHSRFTYSELENHYTQRKKQKNNNEDLFDSMSQEKLQAEQFDQVFNQENLQNQDGIDNNNNNQNNSQRQSTLTDDDIQKMRAQQEQSFHEHQQQQQQIQYMKQQQHMNGENNNNNNNNFNDFQNNKTEQHDLKIENSLQENNGFDFNSYNQSNNQENVIASRKNMQFINMKRGATDDNEFMAN